MSRSSVGPRLRTAAVIVMLLTGAASACTRCVGEGNPSQRDGGPPPKSTLLAGNDGEQVLATVGTARITLADYAAALSRMDRYERLRYQSTERRVQLLEEMVDLELLAGEALRLGLDRDPEVAMRLDQALRDELLQDLKQTLPSPQAIPEAEVRAYYEAHRTEFEEPERRRIGAIVVADTALAERLAEQAARASAAEFGELVRRHSHFRAPPDENTPIELEGDLGIVSLEKAHRGAKSAIPEPVIRAVFALEKIGDVAPRPVAAEGRNYVVRLTGRTERRQRTLAEADRAIRLRLVDQKLREAEARLIAEAKKSTRVVIDEGALQRAPLPAPKPSESLREALAP
jgi:peptidyl-prolyl cis-trans isomerase C